MPQYPSPGTGLGRIPFRIAGLYAVFGLLWIWLSDSALIWLGFDPDQAFLAGALKGTLYVAVTAALLGWVVRREVAVAQRSETLLRAVVEGTTDAVFVKDREGKYLLANESAASFIGRPVGDVLGRFDHELFGADDARQIVANDRTVMADGNVVTFEESITSPSGRRTYHATKAPLLDAHGKVAGVIGVSRDFTSRKATEIALLDSEKRYRELGDAIPQIVWTASPDGAIVHLNSKAVEYTGLQVADLAGWSWQRVIHPDDQAYAVAEWSRALAEGVPHPFEMRIRRADGAHRWHIVRQLPLRDSAGVIESWVGTCTDIDDLKQTKNALHETDTRLREAQRIARLGSWVWEPRTGKVAWSDAEFELFGMEPGSRQPSFESFLSLLPPDEQSIAISRVEAMKAGANEFANDMRIIRPDGQCIWIHSRARATRDADGNILQVEGTDQDITARVTAEEALRTSESRYRLMFESNPHPMWVYNIDTFRFVAVNDTAVMAYGYSRDEFLAMSIRDIRPSEDIEQLEAVVARLTPGPTHSSIWRHRRKDGTVIDVDVTSHSLPDDGGRTRLVMALDVTERLRAERARDELLARLQLHIDRMPIAYVLCDADIRYSNWNPAAEKIFGYTREEIIGQSPHLLVHPDDHKHVDAISSRLRSGDVAAHSISRNVTKDGRVITCEWHNTPLFSSNGSFVGILSMTLDVTDRVRAEAALQESERRLRLALEAAGAIAFTWDIKNDTVTRYFSNEPALPVTSEKLGTLNEVRARIHHNDVAGFDARLSAGLAGGGTEYRNQFRVVRPDGAVTTLEDHGYFHRASDGSPLSLTGFSIDISDRVAATDALRISEERLRVALQGAKGGVWDWDLVSQNVWWSPEVYSLMGAPSDMDTREAEAIELIYESDRPKVLAAVADAIARRVDYHCEFRVNGGARWLSSHARLFCNSAGDPERLLGISWDISDRMTAMEALRDSEERYRRLVAVLPTAVLIHNGDRVLYCNPAFVRLIGAESADEVLGRRPIDCVFPDDRAKVFAKREETISAGENASGIEMRFLRSDGRSVLTYAVATLISGYGPNAFLIAVTDLSERERAAQLLSSVLRSVGDAIVTIDERGTITSANPATLIHFGYSEYELLGHDVARLIPEQHRNSLGNILSTGLPSSIGIGREVECLRSDGTLFPAELTVTEFMLEGRRHFTGVLRDITERLRLQSQFIQAQKMEAVGRLAGGVAHDFNNLLTIISGYCELLLMSDLPHGDKRRESIATIRDAGERAARLTQQLLAFSRKALITPKVIDLNELVSNSARFLRRLIGEDIILAVVTAPMPISIKADPGQLEQVIMNLVVNARDAMPTGGRLIIETSIDSPADGSLSRMARLSVSDTGQGMSNEVKEKIFEPFFTTKGVGKGTGLGLAVVHGVVTQSGGKVVIESTVNVGTTFQILLPLIATPVDEATADSAQYAIPGSETLLLVEDEDAVRRITRISLQTRGFTVLEASDGVAALKVSETYHGEIHLLISDVVMPDMGGRQLADAIRQQRPDLRVLFMSGYTDDAVLMHGVIESTDAFIQKPFTPLSLTRKVREVIDSPPA
jgi:PAS domain S-box-containing protein